MQFLVIGEYVEHGALVPPDQVASIIENAILPSLEILARWVEQGTARGGIYAGERAGAFIVEAESPEALGAMLAGLPFWGIVQWEVRPLQSVRSAVERERSAVQMIRSAPGR
jgi:hypothetical protein